MLFGTRDRFGIEAEYMETYDTFMYAHLRFWIDGQPIGLWEDSADLAASARWGRAFLKASARRTRPDLDHRSTAEVFHELFGKYIHWPDDKSPGPWDRAPYDLEAVGDSSVRDKAMVLVVRRSDGLDRLILKDYRDDSLKEIVLEPGVCDEIVSAYCAWVDTLPQPG